MIVPRLLTFFGCLYVISFWSRYFFLNPSISYLGNHDGPNCFTPTAEQKILYRPTKTAGTEKITSWILFWLAPGWDPYNGIGRSVELRITNNALYCRGLTHITNALYGLTYFFYFFLWFVRPPSKRFFNQTRAPTTRRNESIIIVIACARDGDSLSLAARI